MPTRFNIKSSTRFGVPGLPSGYEQGNTPDLTVPPCGIEDVDEALFNLFSKEINFQVKKSSADGLEPVHVIFAAGEKWASVKKAIMTRDRTKSLRLPLISIGRTGLTQAMSGDITGRGMNQHTGEIVVKRRLDVNDRDYQKLINRYLIANQDNVAVDPKIAGPNQLSTLRTTGDIADDPDVYQGGSLKANLNRNVFEIIVMPTPQFYTATYEVTLWGQYTQHMNSMIELIFSSMLPQVKGWKIVTRGGYWFVARISDDSINIETNFDNMSQEERTLKYKFNVEVQAALFASSAPGVPVSIKRYVSAPDVEFTVSTFQSTLDEEPFLGSDDPTLPSSIEMNNPRVDRRDVRRTRLYQSGNQLDIDDPALEDSPRGQPSARFRRITTEDSMGRKTVKHVRVASVNSSTGETSYRRDASWGNLDKIVIDE